MSNLDSREAVQAIDPGGMYNVIAGFPEQIRTAVAIATAVEFEPSRYDNIGQIVVVGMGGSAIAGDLAWTLLKDRLPCPIHVCRDYDLPAFVGPETLVIGSSYSGTTEETLTAFDLARKADARLFALTTGGRLGEICEEYHIPMARLPGGLQPRAALGYSFIPLLLFLHRIGLSKYDADDCRTLADFLERRGEKFAVENASDDNPAKQLALQLYGRIPIIYSGPGLTGALATRIKGQICENAKMLAFSNQIPEMNHNELVGWKVINAYRDFLRVLILRDQDDDPRVTRRMDIVREIISEAAVKVVDIQSEGNDQLQRMMSLVQFGDFVSLYLAVLNKTDPTPVKVIEYLKEQLAQLE